MKKIIKSLEIRKSFMRKFEIKFFIMVTVGKRIIQENDSFVEFFFEFLGLNSSVVGLFIDFSTSGLSFLKNCWGLVLWCSGGLLYFIFTWWIIWGISEIFVL